MLSDNMFSDNTMLSSDNILPDKMLSITCYLITWFYLITCYLLSDNMMLSDNMILSYNMMISDNKMLSEDLLSGNMLSDDMLSDNIRIRADKIILSDNMWFFFLKMSHTLLNPYSPESPPWPQSLLSKEEECRSSPKQIFHGIKIITII
jgi:hypothetical protein